jgi:hypothetical protein
VLWDVFFGVFLDDDPTELSLDVVEFVLDAAVDILFYYLYVCACMCCTTFNRYN